jgi:hypothetical protein
MNISNINAFRMELKMQGFDTSDTPNGSSPLPNIMTNNKSDDKSNPLDKDFKSMDISIIKLNANIASLTGKNTATQSFAEFFSNANKNIKMKDHEKVKEFIDKEINPYEIGYKGKPITELTPEEAAKLIAEDGFFGINNTSSRVADFIIEAAKGNLDKLSQGREGIMKGFKMAEKLWGEKLPDISYDTLKETLKKLDENIGENGGNVIDKKA